ncbi:hypothetical protein AN189_09970 [Loktanella sp. 3ANDIMAR09]|uniref:hypothetical protein n=1 Tax=Loktanella sp. 3ANDIMAR09 TaxID=1225657 RepID=UPI0006FBF8A1|nr:hypothetical protein [Loktanella sp. 3ANDIMAR09]KQI68615.1 hypothetical protein AN189_09970 [Loktanella sp. 3ANDIMAR09]
MNDLKSLEYRINTALDRIRSHVGEQAGQSDLRAQLATQQAANAALEDRVAALKARQDDKIAKLEAEVAAHADRMTELDGALQRLRAANADLREEADALRQAAMDGVPDAADINRALIAEVEALQADRAAEAAEVAALLGELKPALQQEG